MNLYRQKQQEQTAALSYSGSTKMSSLSRLRKRKWANAYTALLRGMATSLETLHGAPRTANNHGSVFEKTCATTQKNVKSHVFLKSEKNVKKTLKT